MAEEREDELPSGDLAPSDVAHDQVGAVLDGVEADLDAVTATLARMG